MNKEQIIDEAHKRYVMLPKELSEVISDNEKFNGRNFTQEEFINKCKTDPEFSEKWGLKIEERELSGEMRYNIWFNNNYETGMEKYFDPNKLPDFDNEYYEPTPTKLIKITYNNETIESYEN